MEPGKRDRLRLAQVHPDLIKVVEGAFNRFIQAFRGAPSFNLFVIEGVRTKLRQVQMVATGASQTMNSLHIIQADGYGHAVDLGISAGGSMRWEFPVYRILWEQCVFPAARDLSIVVEWGGNWESLHDGPHFQLSRAAYQPHPEVQI